MPYELNSMTFQLDFSRTQSYRKVLLGNRSAHTQVCLFVCDRFIRDIVLISVEAPAPDM